MLGIEIIQQLILTLASALLLVWLSRLPKYSLFFSSILFLLLVLGVNLIPLLRGSSLVEILRGVIGDVSTASGVLLLLIIANQFDFSDKRQPVLSVWERWWLILTGVGLYLSTFGFIGFDIYHLGYLSQNMLIAFSGITFALLIFNRPLGYVWLLAIISYYFRMQHSNNLWDYFYDPLLWLTLIFSEIVRLTRLFSRKKDHDDLIII